MLEFILYTALGVILSLVAFWFAVSVYLWRQAKWCMPGEDLDGDTRNTMFGVMLVYHFGGTTWVQHMRYNTTLYKRLAAVLVVFGLFLFAFILPCVSLLMFY